MASEPDHIRLANRNHDLLLELLQAGRHPDWAVTVAFYKAVHVVEAVFAVDMGRHSTGHSDREKTLKLPRFNAISVDFSHLLMASKVARYLESSAGTRYSTFSDFMDIGDVKDKIIR